MYTWKNVQKRLKSIENNDIQENKFKMSMIVLATLTFYSFVHLKRARNLKAHA